MIGVSLEKYQIYRIASVSPRVEIGNPMQNIANILEELDKPELKTARIVVFPELSISGYTCGDLFFQNSLIQQCSEALFQLARILENDTRLIAVGLPFCKDGKLFNCAAVIAGGKICGLVPKSHIPNYQEFYERRWFSSGEGIEYAKVRLHDLQIPFGKNLIFSFNGVLIGLEICEDLWVPNPPSSLLCQHGAEVILNLSATDDNTGKYTYIKSLIRSQSARCRCAYSYASAGAGESSTDLVFSGINIIANDGEIIGESERFSRKDSFCLAYVDIEKIRQDRRKYSTFYDGVISNADYQIIDCGSNYETSVASETNTAFKVNPYPFIPTDVKERDLTCREIINIQSWGLSQRLLATGCRHLVVGISGGLDSTLSLLVAHYTFKKLNIDPEDIIGVTMPAEATSSRTYMNALQLMRCLGVNILEIPIKDAVAIHFRDIEHKDDKYDAVYENAQARERTQILMDLSNKYNGMVLGTGDMSELALGWCTFNGDHISMYNVNAGVPKTLVRHLVNWFAENASSEDLRIVLEDILDTPISPELIPADTKNEISQKTEEIVGPYELHDFFLFHVLRNGFSPSKIFVIARIAFNGKYDDNVILHWLVNFYKRFFAQQFKRSCMPDGPKIGSVCLSPRGDWRMPSDASAKLWLEEVNNLIK